MEWGRHTGQHIIRYLHTQQCVLKGMCTHLQSLLCPHLAHIAFASQPRTLPHAHGKRYAHSRSTAAAFCGTFRSHTAWLMLRLSSFCSHWPFVALCAGGSQRRNESTATLCWLCWPHTERLALHVSPSPPPPPSSLSPSSSFFLLAPPCAGAAQGTVGPPQRFARYLGLSWYG
eukprot:scaffold279207_cov21-Tisochrysis_lutea.AAC.1